HAERAIDSEMPCADFKSMVSALSQPALFGRTGNSYGIVNIPDGRPQMNLFMSRAAFSDLDLEGFRRAIRAKIPDSGSVRIHAISAPRHFVNFIADDLAQAGFSSYRLIRTDSSEVGPRQTSSTSIENEFFRLSPTNRGLEIGDHKQRTKMELYFEDDGDRGDEYNFAPVAETTAIAQPASIS